MSSSSLPRRNIKLLISYDGTVYSGWQRQGAPGSAGQGIARETVQGTIEKALEKIHKEAVALTGSGRTDSGVHAAAQGANFYTHIKSMEDWRFVPALNSLLPRDIRILDSRETLEDFHARFDTRQRTYRYFFIYGRDAQPWELRYAMHLKHQPDIRLLNSYARLFRGEMDCTAFAVPGDESKSRSRYISSASFFLDGSRLVFEISANAFLWKMVRSIAGTLVHFEEKKIKPGYLGEIISSGMRSMTGPTAPPEGLFLWKVDYYRE